MEYLTNNKEDPKPHASEKLKEELKKNNVTSFDDETIEYFARQLESSGFKSVGFIRFGADSVAMEIEGGRFLKIYEGKRPKNEKGTRSFDIPILEYGEFTEEPGIDFPLNGYYIIQPLADTNVSFEETRDFITEIKSMGYTDADIGYDAQKQLGFYKNKLYLLDYDAVHKNSMT